MSTTTVAPDLKTIEEKFHAVASALRTAVDDAARQISGLQDEAGGLPDDHDSAVMNHRIEWARTDIETIQEMLNYLGEWSTK